MIHWKCTEGLSGYGSLWRSGVTRAWMFLFCVSGLMYNLDDWAVLWVLWETGDIIKVFPLEITPFIMGRGDKNLHLWISGPDPSTNQGASALFKSSSTCRTMRMRHMLVISHSALNLCWCIHAQQTGAGLRIHQTTVDLDGGYGIEHSGEVNVLVSALWLALWG